MEQNSFLDESSLLLMNRSGREKLTKTDFDVVNNDSTDILKYKSMILEFTENKLNAEKDTSNILDDIFQTYVKHVIQHFKQKETENANLYNTIDLKSEEDNLVQGLPTTQSFWSKHKVIKKNM
tara:strand:+ start:171 stop:539 length:369 start_codon:yes stop_codon:yes gene_type:complete